ncbi:MAG: helix-turn-helix transcriptional regulator [Clostridia bacterium]|nr:helix-turn-helix transcriptional regulator [Clostridia bacterium]
MANKNLLSQELKSIKEKHHITNEEWSKRSGVPVSSIARFLSSSLNIPNFPAVCAMLKCLGESIDEFYNRLDEKIGAPAEALKLDAVPVSVVGDIPVDMPETKVEIQERIIVQAEEMQRLKAVEREKDMQIEMLEARLDIMERTMDAIKSLCSAH